LTVFSEGKVSWTGISKMSVYGNGWTDPKLKFYNETSPKGNSFSLGNVVKQTFCNESVLRAVKLSGLDQEFGGVEVKKFQWSVIRFKKFSFGE
jgi:hypothetical protein